MIVSLGLDEVLTTELWAHLTDLCLLSTDYLDPSQFDWCAELAVESMLANGPIDSSDDMLTQAVKECDTFDETVVYTLFYMSSAKRLYLHLKPFMSGPITWGVAVEPNLGASDHVTLSVSYVTQRSNDYHLNYDNNTKLNGNKRKRSRSLHRAIYSPAGSCISS